MESWLPARPKNSVLKCSRIGDAFLIAFCLPYSFTTIQLYHHTASPQTPVIEISLKDIRVALFARLLKAYLSS